MGRTEANQLNMSIFYVICIFHSFRHRLNQWTSPCVFVSGGVYKKVCG